MSSRLRLDLDLDPPQVLSRLRGRRRLAALLGSGWAHGEALIAFDPLRDLVTQGDAFDVVDTVPRRPLSGIFEGGWIGYWGYQLAQQLEDVPTAARLPDGLPGHVLGYYDRALRHRGGRWWAEGAVDPESLAAWAAEVLDDLVQERSDPTLDHNLSGFIPDRTPAAHQAAVRAALGHIHDGDVFQVNVCTTFRASFSGEPVDLLCAGYSRLRPAFAAYVAWDGGAVVSLSPELFLRQRGERVLTSPIKGTAPRRADAHSDRLAEQALIASTKDRAENVMIVDLMRNDLAKVCIPSTVKAFPIRAEPHAVWHLVSDVSGHLPARTSHGDLLRATFPPGSVTGAPKVRALELIAELEPVAREAYTGAIGCVSAGIGLEMNVAIRTLEFNATRREVVLGVGGGITVGSDPAKEWAECLTKAIPIVDAIGGRLEVTPEHLDAPGAVAAPSGPGSATHRDAAAVARDCALVVVKDSQVLVAPSPPDLATRDPRRRARSRLLSALYESGLPVEVRELDEDDILQAVEILGLDDEGDVRDLSLTRPDGAMGSVLDWVGQRVSSRPGRWSTRAGGAAARDARVLFIDNYDSFVYNLVDYTRQSGAHARVVRNDEFSVEDLVAWRDAGQFTHLLISPGPGAPRDAGLSVEIIRRLGSTTPTLGVCLGHQAIVEAYGGHIVHAPGTVHGTASIVHHNGLGLWAGLWAPVLMGRYHSLSADPESLPDDLLVTATTGRGVIMGIQHRRQPVVGVQAHPESILSPVGLRLLRNFLSMGSVGHSA